MTDRFRTAYEAAHQCLVLANTVRLCVEEATAPLTDASPDLVDEMTESFASTMLELMRAIDNAEQRLAVVHEALMSVSTDVACVGKRSYGSFHEAVVNVANRVLEEAWNAADKDGFRNSDLNGSKLASGFAKAIRSHRFKRPSWASLPKIDDELFQQLRKEAVTAANQHVAANDRQQNNRDEDGPQAPNVFVWCGNAIELNGRQLFALASVLWDNRGQWVNVEYMEGVFRDEYPSESAVEKAVKRLRTAMDETPILIGFRKSPLAACLSLSETGQK